MPHLILPYRPQTYGSRYKSTTDDENGGSKLNKHHFWENFNAWVYLVGGLMFIVGSIFFLPKYEDLEPVGSWIFVVASVLYVIVAIHDYYVIQFIHASITKWVWIDRSAAWSYITGSTLFIAGSIFFLPTVANYTAGAWTFIIGSTMFVAGAMLHGLQIYEAETQWDSQYLLLSAMLYILGSALFLVASIPYLLNLESVEDTTAIDAFAAGVYLFGSLCFFVGGALNFRRNKLVQKDENDNNNIATQQTSSNDRENGADAVVISSNNDEGNNMKQQQETSVAPVCSGGKSTEVRDIHESEEMGA